MQQHPTQPMIETSQKMIATTNSGLTMPDRKKLTRPITKQTRYKCYNYAKGSLYIWILPYVLK
jgi:hypothetical protein